MFHFSIIFRTITHPGRCCAAVGLALCLALCGCRGWDLRGDKYDPDPTLELPRDLRRPDTNNEFWGFSNKARQIEGNLGVKGN